jgi:hypothetical protein
MNERDNFNAAVNAMVIATVEATLAVIDKGAYVRDAFGHLSFPHTDLTAVAARLRSVRDELHLFRRERTLANATPAEAHLKVSPTEPVDTEGKKP